jgi:deferrochelatase/peroxidase EfeB
VRRDLTFKTASIAGASDLTILAPIKKGLVPALDAMTYKTRVKRVLRLLHLGRTISHEYEIGRVISDAVERVGKIHSIRIAILEPEDKVLLVVTFDGAWESYIRVIWQKVSRLLDLIFCNTEGYKLGWESTYDDWCAWLRSAQAETMFLYSQPNLSNTDTHYLQSIERIHRRESDLQMADKEVAKFTMPSAESNAKSIWLYGVDLKNSPSSQKSPPVLIGLSFRQGLRTLVGLYHLSDAYMPTLGDGDILLRAAQELLAEFNEMVTSDETKDVFSVPMVTAKTHYLDALRWFFTAASYERTVPDLPPSQTNLYEQKDIQGGILDAYSDVSDGCLLLVAFRHTSEMAIFLKAFKPTTIFEQEKLQSGQIAQNISITVEGLRKSGYRDEEIAELPEEFIQGMDKRQGVLGDLYVNHPRRWRLPVLNWQGGINAQEETSDFLEPRVQLSSVHAVIQLRLRAKADATDSKEKLLEKLNEILGKDKVSGDFRNGATPLSIQWMHGLKDTEGKGVEHFGFREAASNPVYHRASSAKVPKFDNQVHIGEVLHGYPNKADHGAPANGAKSERVKKFLKNGSFLVIRKLRQDVGVLDAVLSQATATEPALSREILLAKMMGRWPAGAQNSDGEDIEGQRVGVDEVSADSNDFNFSGDGTGEKCPFHAHIRRANPRADKQEIDSTGKRTPRIVRRGMSYGARHIDLDDADANAKSLNSERGLVFMAYNASIGEQFEVIQRWIAGGNSTGTYSGQNDPFLGVAEPGRPRIFQFLHNDKVQRIALDGSDEIHTEAAPLVRLEWGMYLFTPSISALTELADRASKQGQVSTIEWSVERGALLIAELQALEKECGRTEAKLAWKTALEDPDSATDFKTSSIWAAIRKNHGGVLKTPFGVLVASQSLADQVLLDTAGNLTAHGYLPRMSHSFGALYLGMDAGRTDLAYEKESAVANDAVLEIGKNFKNTVSIAEKIVHEAIDKFVFDAIDSADADELRWQAAIDVRDLIDKVIAKFCEEWFGLSEEGGFFERGGMKWLSPVDSEAPRYPGHFMAPSRYVFQPHPSDTVRDVASIHGKALNRAMTSYLRAYGTKLKSSPSLVKTILEKGDELGDAGYAPRTILGLMMGFVPTTDGLMRRIALEWFREGRLWSLRSQLTGIAAGNVDHPDFSGSFSQAFKNAFLLRAAPELLWRTAKNDHAIGSGSHAVQIKSGETVIVGQISATHEGLESDGTAGFEDSYVYAFGDNRKHLASPKPTHACPGRSAAMGVMRGFLQGLVTCKHPMRPGAGALSFVVEGEVAQSKSGSNFEGLEGWSDMGAHLEQHAGSDQPTIPLFAIGDSWVYQYIELPTKGVFNLVTTLRKEGFSFEASSNNYPKISKDLINQFTMPGKKLVGLELKEAALTKRQTDLDDKKNPLEVMAILMSAGGNDIAAHEKNKKLEPDYKTARLFGLLVENPDSLEVAFDLTAKNKFFDELKEHYKLTLKMLLARMRAPILIHGYDFPIPDGRPALYDGKLAGLGPWLQGVFDEKKIRKDLHKTIMRDLIGRLNTLISDVVIDVEEFFSDEDRARLHFVNFAGILEKQDGYNDPPDGYKTYWANELHPTQRGFEILSQVVIDKLTEIGVVKADADIATVPAVAIVQ